MLKLKEDQGLREKNLHFGKIFIVFVYPLRCLTESRKLYDSKKYASQEGKSKNVELNDQDYLSYGSATEPIISPSVSN
jgi:hypothetical protein